MYRYLKKIVIALALVIVAAAIAIPVLAATAESEKKSEVTQAQLIETENELQAEAAEIQSVSAAGGEKTGKALSASAVVGVVAAVGAISMSIAISKAVEGTARQPEAGSKIQTMLMLGLVFIETAIIYALIVAILVIFVL